MHRLVLAHNFYVVRIDYPDSQFMAVYKEGSLTNWFKKCIKLRK